MSQLRTTILKIDPNALDWTVISGLGNFVEYSIPYHEKTKWDYLHNWYLKNSTYPYYLNSAGAKLYVKYPPGQTAPSLTYDGRAWMPKQMNIQALDNFHALVKLLVSDYFHQRQVFVSNSDFYLLMYSTDKGNLKVLKIELQQQWKDNEYYGFAVINKATTIVPARDFKPGNMHGAFYFIDHVRALPILRRLNPTKITQRHIDQGIYTKLSRRNYRTQVRYLSVSNERGLRRSRLYPLWFFLDGLVGYFNKLDIPFYLKEHSYKKVNQVKATELTKPPFDLSGSTMCIIDDRIRPIVQPTQEPDGFADDLVNKIQAIVDSKKWTPELILKTKADLSEGDLVLRLQDNQADDFAVKVGIDKDGQEHELNNAILRDYQDPYKVFRKDYSNVISQSLNVNFLASADDEDVDDGDEYEDTTASAPDEEPQSIETYMGYKQPGKKWLEIPLMNSLYQLYLKSVIHTCDDAIDRLPALAMMRDNIFLFANAMVYLDNGSLRFMQTTNNPAAIELIKERTGWDLLEDVIMPAHQRRYYRPEEKEASNILKLCHFIVHKDYVWEIDDSPEQVLYDIPELEKRLNERERDRPKSEYKPTYSEAELRVFEAEKLRKFAAYLDNSPRQFFSFRDLTSLPIKGDIYPILGIKNSIPLQSYLSTKGIDLSSPKGKDVILAYEGISYIPATRQYYVGNKNSMPSSYRQERGFIFRRVVVHQSKPDLPPLFDLLREQLFPLLEVNFVRYNQYTVYPFPFNLIEIWNELVAGVDQDQDDD